MKSWWVKLLLGLGAILLVLLVWFLTSGVHSKSALDQYKDQLRAAGEKLTVDELAPPHVEPDKNGAPIFNEAIPHMGSDLGVISSNPPPVMRMVGPGKAMIGWEQAEIRGNAATNSWEDLELALQDQAAAFDLILKASERPKFDFDLDYKQGHNLPLTHLSKLKEAALLFSTAAEDDLHRGDSSGAVTNLHTILMILNTWKDEPALLSQLFRTAMAQIAAGAQWELLQATNVTDQQLASLQNDWANAEFGHPMENALLMQRAWDCLMIQEFRASKGPPGSLGARSSVVFSGDWLDDIKEVGKSMRRKTSDTIWRVSWSYDDELRQLQAGQVIVEAARQSRTNGFFKDALAERDRKMKALGLGVPDRNWLRNGLNDEFLMLGESGVSGVGRSLNVILSHEAERIMVISAIAIKRYQLRHAALPSTLSALVPEFLSMVPRDPVDGHPLRYQLNSDGTFLLYSIGEDGVDNGGDATPTGSFKTFYWPRGRDWVWPQPATAQEVQDYYDNPPK